MAPLPVNTEFLCTLALKVGAPAPVGDAGKHDLRIVPVIGGTATGPGLNAEVVAGASADWLRIEPDGTTHIDVKLTLRTASGAHLFLQYNGFRAGPPEVLAALGRGEAVPVDQYYFRVTARFETAEPSLAWLNRVVVVGIGQRPPTGPQYDLYVVK